MKILFEKITDIIDAWTKALDDYNLASLHFKPAPVKWSIGQLYIHLITDTQFYIEQAQTCLSTNENQNENKSAAAEIIFRNGFPDKMIEGAPSNAFIPQPQNKEQLVNGLLNLKNEMSTLAIAISSSSFKGKTKHPGLGYFSAAEWLQFAEMHFRHHLRQKKRIDDFLSFS
jgi:hypothetical protein